MQGKVSSVPEWFHPLLEEWGIEYGKGAVVDLSARSCTQILWKENNSKVFSTTGDDRHRVDIAFKDLREYAEFAAGLIEFVYLGGARRSMREVEVAYKLSNRAAGVEVGAAEALMYSGFMRLLKAA